ncbi:MAG: ABC transporter permease [Actinomycetes bacterium]
MARGDGGSLRRYALTRIALVLPMVFILVTLVFVLMRVAPGDPVTAALGGHLDPAELARRRHEAGYDRSILAQYGSYLRQIVTGQLGHPIIDPRSIGQIITENGGATLELTFFATAIALVVGIPLGMLAARRRDTPLDAGIRLFGIVTYAAPVFFVGLLLQLWLSRDLNLLPNSGEASVATQEWLTAHTVTHVALVDALIGGNGEALVDLIKHLIMPAFTLGLLICGVFIRLVRVNLIQSLRGDYVEAARARGIRERRVVMRHAFRNALVPVVTVMGLQTALLLSGAVLTEETFNWPGIGFTLIRSLNQRDYIAVQGIITVFALIVVFVSILIDFVNAAIDPRVRYQ